MKVSMSMFALNRKRLCKKLAENEKVPKGAIVVLQGGEQQTRYCSDTDVVFRQVNNSNNKCIHPFKSVLENNCM